MDTMEREGAGSPFLHPRAADALVMAASPMMQGPRPVAVVLEDGTEHSLVRRAAGIRDGATGLLSGRDWTFRWELRSWSGA